MVHVCAAQAIKGLRGVRGLRRIDSLQAGFVHGPGNEKTCLRVKFSIFLFSWKYEYWNIRSPEKNFGHNLAIKSGSESQKRTIYVIMGKILPK